MISLAYRSPYICQQCRTRLSLLTTFVALHRRKSSTDSAVGKPSPPLPPPSPSPSPLFSDRQRSRKNDSFSPPKLGHYKRTAQWSEVGLRPVVVDALLKAFPNASRATSIQRRFIDRLNSRTTLIANSPPKSGKSFAIALWLMSLEPTASVTDPSRLSTTALVLAPNSELVQKYYMQIRRLLEASGSPTLMRYPERVVQALYRTSDEEETAQLHVLRENPGAHIIVATPTRVLDLLASRNPKIREAFDFESLRVIVLEEIDSAVLRYMDEQTKSPKKAPIALLVDFIFRRRREAYSHGGVIPPPLPQLVIPTSVSGPVRLHGLLARNHSWWGVSFKHCTTCELELGSSNLASSTILENRTNHIVGFDPRTDELRDIPLPKVDDAPIFQAIKAEGEQEARINTRLEQALRGKRKKLTDEDREIIKYYRNTLYSTTRRGYPAPGAAAALRKLLIRDKWPRNVVAILADESSQTAFIEACAARGVRARRLSFHDWNDRCEFEGRLPIGRTDKLVGESLSPSSNRILIEDKEGGESTTVWVTNHNQVRGIDLPGANHVYILHRLHSMRQYLLYANLVAPWPYRRNEELVDPRFLGRSLAPQGTVVYVVLERRVGGGQSEITEMDEEQELCMVIADGGEQERWIWRREALRYAQVGVPITPYLSEGAGEPIEAGGEVTGGREQSQWGVPPVAKAQSEEREKILESTGAEGEQPKWERPSTEKAQSEKREEGLKESAGTEREVPRGEGQLEWGEPPMTKTLSEKEEGLKKPTKVGRGQPARSRKRKEGLKELTEAEREDPEGRGPPGWEILPTERVQSEEGGSKESTRAGGGVSGGREQHEREEQSAEKTRSKKKEDSKVSTEAERGISGEGGQPEKERASTEKVEPEKRNGSSKEEGDSGDKELSEQSRGSGKEMVGGIPGRKEAPHTNEPSKRELSKGKKGSSRKGRGKK